MDSNPFSSRFIRPGATEYQFPSGFDIGHLLGQFEYNRRRGQILGPHGTGKSTLLWSIKRELERNGAPFVFYCLHAYRRADVCYTSPSPSQSAGSAEMARNAGTIGNADVSGSESSQNQAIQDRKTIVIIDGFEQLPFWRRWQIRIWTKIRQQGLLISGHFPLGLPILWNTTLDVDRAVDLANRQRLANLGQGVSRSGYATQGDSLADDRANESIPEIDPEEIRRLFTLHDGNLREVYFDLYDLYSFPLKFPKKETDKYTDAH